MQHLLAKQTPPCNLFGWEDWPAKNGYPVSPGWKRTDTSREAAEAIAPIAKDLRSRVLSLLQSLAPNEALTADQIAVRLQRSPLCIRPRVSELAVAGMLIRAEQRGKNESGMSAAKWKAAP
jgi:DNA-binding GntR family transcriptional regulator